MTELALKVNGAHQEVSRTENALEWTRLIVGSAAVSVLILIVFVGIALNYSTLKLFPLINFIILIVCLIILAYVEALHFACVAVEKWDMNEYAAYPRAIACQKLVDTPAKVKKFLVGRQFFVIFIVFLLAQITTYPDIPKNFAGLPEILVLILIQTGLPGIAITLTVGQLIGQIYVEEYTIEVLNIYGCETLIRTSLIIEWIGVTHFSWLLFGISSRLCCKSVRRMQLEMDSQKSSSNMLEPMSPTEKNRGPNFDTGLHDDSTVTVFDVARYAWSSIATLGSVLIICYGISLNVYVLPTPPIGGFIIAIVMMTVLFYLEGLMIAIVGTQYWDPETFKTVYPKAYTLHQIMNKPNAIKRFVVGRQFFTVLTNFLLAQIFTFHHWKAGSINKVLFYIVVQSGLVGVMVILSFSQLMPELLAAEFPLRFMNMYGSITITNMCLFFDTLGVGHCAWAVYYSTKYLFCHRKSGGMDHEVAMKPAIVRVQSAEVLAVTRSEAWKKSEIEVV